LYTFTSSPWKGHALIERIARSFYRDSPNGLIGNDDCGQMSAWLVFATLGLYPVTPGQGQYISGLPLVKTARIHLHNKTLTIRTQLPSVFSRQRSHAHVVLLDGQAIESYQHISHQALLQAQTLEFQVVKRS
jgi:putative alpha-1,2-mannosidase